MRCAVRQLADAITGMSRQAFHAPGFGEFLAVSRIFHVLVSRIRIRQRAHIAGTLHVVLTTNRVYTRMRLTEVTSQHREAGQRTHGFHALVELGYTHAPQDGGAFRLGIHPRRLTNLTGADAGDIFNRLRRVAFNDFTILFKAFCTGSDESFVVQVFFNNDMAHRIQQRDVRAVFQCNVHVSNARGFNFARIADDNFRPVTFSVNYVVRHDWVGIRRVVPENEH